MTRAVLLLVAALLCASLASTAAMQLFPMASHPEVDACVDAEADERRQIQHDHCDMGGVSTCGVDDPVGDRDVRRRRPMHWPDVADAVRRSVRDTATRARDGLGRAVARAKHATEKATERNTDEDKKKKKKKKKRKIPAEPRPERRATPASLYRLPNRSMLGRLAPYAVEGAGFERRPSAFMRPRLSSIPSSGATGDGGIEPTVARPVIDAVASTDHPPSTAERPKAARKAPRVQKRQRAKKPAPAKPPPTPEGFADDVAAAFAAIQPPANRVAMNRGFATIDQVTIGHRELVDACRRHGFYEWSEGDVAKMMAVAGEAVGRDGASCGETRLSLEDFKRVATHVGARRADV